MNDIDEDNVCDEIDDCVGEWNQETTIMSCSDFSNSYSCNAASDQCWWDSCWYLGENCGGCMGGSYQVYTSSCQEFEQGCLDYEACNYNSSATISDNSCIYSADFYDCNDNCLNDLDNDNICDEIDNCVGVLVEDITTGYCASITSQSTCVNYGCTWSQAVYTGVWQWEDLCGYTGNSTYTVCLLYTSPSPRD